MMNKDYFLKVAPDRPFAYKEALKWGASHYLLKKACEKKKLKKLRHGYYQKIVEGYTDEMSFIEASCYMGVPSAICLLSALWFYNLSDEIPAQTWIMVPESKRSQESSIHLLRTREPLWDIGIIKHTLYWITSIERTIVDCLRYKHKIGREIGVKALKSYVGRDHKRMNQVYKMAQDMKFASQILPYLEILAI